MKRIGVPLVLCILFAGLALGTPQFASAQSAAEIQAQIEASNAQIQALKDEIVAYQKELDVLGTKKNTLQSTISTLTITQKQLAAKIKLTQGNIAVANQKIKELTNSIGNKEQVIRMNQDAIAKSLRSIAEEEGASLVTKLISSNTFGEAWKAADEAALFNRALTEDVAELRAVRKTLSENRDQVSTEKAKLLSLQNQLSLEKRSVDASKTAQQQLLTQTKNQESNYQKLIAQKQAAEKAFEQELINLQGQLNLIVNPNLLPRVGSGVLSWPFSLSFMNTCAARKSVFGNIFCISQYFGSTPFSTANPQVYNGSGHNAIDIGAPIGTPVLASLSGTVLATGNTDAFPGCYSFGKWVMVIHGNGLSTLYSHLSVIDVAKGQSVGTGQIIGLSGMTGYATGPHLHFGVYATEGTQILRLGQFRSGVKTGCANAVMPVATLSAYLNPLSYL